MREKTILLVEDNPNDVKLTLRAFERNKILNQVVVVKDGAEALDYLFGVGTYAQRDARRVPAIVLLDLKLPKIDGLAVLRQLRSHPLTKVVPVVILTSSKEEEDIAQGYDLGANSYIRKPVDFAQFTECVRELELYWLVLNEPPPARIVQ